MFHTSKRISTKTTTKKKNFLSATKSSLKKKKNVRVIDRRKKKKKQQDGNLGPTVFEIQYEDAPVAPQASNNDVNTTPSFVLKNKVKVSTPPRPKMKLSSNDNNKNKNKTPTTVIKEKSKLSQQPSSLQKENTTTTPKTVIKVTKHYTNKNKMSSSSKKKQQTVTLRGPWKLHKEQTTSLKAKMAKQTEDLTVANTYHELLREKLKIATDNYSKLNEAYVQLKNQSEILRTKYDILESEKKTLSSKNDQIEKENDDANEQVNALLTQLANSLEENRRLDTVNSKYQNETNVANQEIVNMSKLYDNLEMENEANLERIEVLERRVDIMKKDRSRLEHHIVILSKEKERLHSQNKELESGKRMKTSLSEIKRREKNWKNNSSDGGNTIDPFKFQKASSTPFVDAKGSNRSSNYAKLSNPNLTRKMNVLIKQLENEKERNKHLLKDNKAKDTQINNLQTRLRNIKRYNN